ncbi:MAG: DUF1826 domain-containing protein [Pseudomonadota bacterium]
MAAETRAGPQAVRQADSLAGLAEISAPGTAAVIWQRAPRPEFQTWMDGLAPNLLPRTRTVLRADRVRAAAEAMCAECATPESPERAHLIDDLAGLAESFAALMGTAYLRLRLDVVTTNACRKFHIDALTARLICTYRGRGTEYGLARQGDDPDEIHAVPTGAPVVLRGTEWPEGPPLGLLHRSPPIEGTGETRLLLVLDPVADPEEHPARKFVH